MSAGALEALRKELPRGAMAGQNGRTYRDPVAVPSVRNMAVQVDHLKHAPVKVPLGQPSGTPSVKTTAIQAGLPQRLPVTLRIDDPRQTKEVSYKDHL
jgi:hypothetical protein